MQVEDVDFAFIIESREQDASGRFTNDNSNRTIDVVGSQQKIQLQH